MKAGDFIRWKCVSDYEYRMSLEAERRPSRTCSTSQEIVD